VVEIVKSFCLGVREERRVPEVLRDLKIMMPISVDAVD